MPPHPNFPQVEAPSPEGRTIARHYQTGQTFRLTWKHGMLESLAPCRDDSNGLWVAPGLIDLQVNGYAGIDFQRDDTVTTDSLLKAARALRRDGCHRILLTLITAEWPALVNRVKTFRQIIQGHPELRQAIPGWHIEGPFLSDQPGFSGAHNPKWMQDPTVQHIRELKQIFQNDPVLLTFAPERSGSAEAIAEATRCGFVVSFGHTNASTSQIQEAIASGGRAFTHLGNGCTQSLDRHDNILWRVLDDQRLIAGLIPDGHHVAPALFRIFHHVLGPSRVYWTTDAMAAAGAPEGSHTIGEIKLMVGPDRVVRNPATCTFAGSALEPIEGIRRGARMLNQPWQKVWDYFSVHPARLMGLRSDLGVGSPAGFCLLRES